MNKTVPVLIGFLLLALTLWFQLSSITSIQRLIVDVKNIAYDWQLRTKSQLIHTKLKTSVVIVDIDDKSISTEGRWPWPRIKLAELIQQIQNQGAAVVALDILFPEPEPNIAETVLEQFKKEKLLTPSLLTLFKNITPSFNNDEKLSTALGRSDSVIGVAFLNENKTVGELKPPLLKLTRETEEIDFIASYGFLGANPIIAKNVKSMGFVNLSNEEGIIRRVPLLIKYDNGIYPSLALEAVRVFLLTDVNLTIESSGKYHNLEGIKIGATTIPTDEKSRVIVPFRGPSYTFPYYSATDVLNNKTPQDAFVGKIVFVGLTATGLGELKPVAIDNAFPGVEIQATIADGILKNDFWYKPAWAPGAEFILTCVSGLILILLYPFVGARILLLLTILVPIIIIYFNDRLLERTGVLISMFFPVMLSITFGGLSVAYGYIFESRRRERLKKIFGQYVPEEHINQMLKARNEYGLEGEDREMTVLFSDIRGFTAISENMPPTQLKEMLNAVFTPLTEIIFETKGTIDKYIGDSIMAFWGAPLSDPEHITHALSCALKMQEKLAQLRPFTQEHLWPNIEIGIGLNCGKMIVGDMGSKFRRNYTVLGDEVNLASRIESLTKYYGVKIIVTEQIQKNQSQFLFRCVDRVRAYGKILPTTVYELIGYKEQQPSAVAQEMELSNHAIHCYFAQQWEQALHLFQQLQKQNTQSKFYRLYIQRISKFKKTPPPISWDGVYIHKKK